jgi:hypothetical protein
MWMDRKSCCIVWPADLPDGRKRHMRDVARGPLAAKNRPRVKPDFARHLKPITAVQSRREKYRAFVFSEIAFS